jgi:hypothetical protein
MRCATALIILAAAACARVAAADDVCGRLRPLCRPYSYIYDSKRWCVMVVVMMHVRSRFYFYNGGGVTMRGNACAVRGVAARG